MADREPYSRIYHSIVDDPKFATVYDDDRRLATWLRLLIVAEQAHPASANIPIGTHRASVVALAEAGLIDLGTASRYRVHGLDAERRRRSDAARVGGLASGRSRSVERPLNDGSPSQGTKSNLDETSRDETRQAEQSARVTDDPWYDPEHEAIVWLAKHGCDIRPGNGYHQKLVVAVEHHGVNALVGMFDRLAAAGTKQGDIKGFLFGAIDALDAQSRPSLAELAAKDREEERDSDFARRLERTRKKNAEIAAAIEAASRTQPKAVQ